MLKMFPSQKKDIQRPPYQKQTEYADPKSTE